MTNASPYKCRQFTCSRITETSALEELEVEWNELFSRIKCCNPFLSYDWMWTWWSYWGHQRRLFIILVRDSYGHLIALAPFSVYQRINGVSPKCLRFLGDMYVGSDHLNLLVDPKYEQSVADEIARELVRDRYEWDYIRLLNCTANSKPISLLINNLKIEGMTQKSACGHVCPFIELPNSTEVYFASLSKSMRYNLRHNIHILEQKFDLKLTFAEEKNEIEKAFCDLIRLHRLRSKRAGRKSSFVQPKVYDFHLNVLKKFTERGWAKIYILNTKHGSVASLYAFTVGKSFMFYQSGSDPNMSKYSLGTVLIFYAIQDAIENLHHQKFDFLRGAEPYKWRWTNHFEKDILLFLFDKRFMSQIARTYIQINALFTNIKERAKKTDWIARIHSWRSH